jgi:hypothetical protein
MKTTKLQNTTMGNEIILGSSKEFGIRYVPGWISDDGKYKFATLHLILTEQIIGSPNETCLLGTWLTKVESILENIQKNPEKLYHKEFKNRTENEIFQMIYKANQMEEEYEEEFSYLPILPNSIWRYCNVGLDETIDAYLLTITSKDDEIKFIWKGWREPCGKEQIGVLNSVMVKKEIVIKTIIECLNLVKQDMRNYKMK